MTDWRDLRPAIIRPGSGVERAPDCPMPRWLEFLGALGIEAPDPRSGLDLGDFSDPEEIALTERLGDELGRSLFHRLWVLDRPAPAKAETPFDLNTWVTPALRWATPGAPYRALTALETSFKQRGADAFDLPVLIGPVGLRVGLAHGVEARAQNVRPGTEGVIITGHVGPGELTGELRGGKLVLRAAWGGSILVAFYAVPSRGSAMFPLPRKVGRVASRVARVQRRLARKAGTR